MFTEKIAAIVGPTYVSCFFMGAMVGLTKVPPPKARRTTRLLMNNYLNNIGKSSAHFANSAAAGVLLYLTTGKMIQYVFLEELEEFCSEETKSALFGSISGALYKSTRGWRPMILTSMLGGAFGYSFNYMWANGYMQFQKRE
mmetsp:Transcript_25571/g.22720  ORF Transcript_25571/g.22720 Transcript_25571/m.22720 type:complete len:142 (+) Transcript_25571:60-485(+)